MNRIAVWLFLGVVVWLAGCAGERQGFVCDEMEYRLNTMTYSPDQRAYAEEELRVCREEESKKKAEGAATRQSIYDRYATSNGGSKKVSSDGESADKDVSVSEALKDSSGVETTSIYDRYKAVEPAQEEVSVPAEAPADTSAADAGSFQ